MGQKVNPIGFRLGVRRNWSARWYANKFILQIHGRQLHTWFHLKEIAIRIGPSHCDRACINKNHDVTIWTARPGIVIDFC